MLQRNRRPRRHCRLHDDLDIQNEKQYLVGPLAWIEGYISELRAENIFVDCDADDVLGEFERRLEDRADDFGAVRAAEKLNLMGSSCREDREAIAAAFDRAGR